jgi:hypothetical protein
VKNPTQKASKRVVNSTPKGARTEHAKSDSTKENTGETRGFRQLLLDIQTDGEGVTKKSQKPLFFLGLRRFAKTKLPSNLP